VDYILGFLNIVIVILTLFLIVLILIQRGKGGGLAGAFGGMGGSSAFGARTGDVFTKVTVGVAVAWILLSMLMVVLTNRKPRSEWYDPAAVAESDLDPGSSAGGDSKKKSKDSTGAASVPSPLPDTLGSTLPPDVKVLTELPDPLTSPTVPPKKD
jgi:preprotein translocase subunit SecG